MNLSKAWLAVAVGILSIATPALCQSALEKEPLSSAEISRSFVGKLVSYSPPGLADAGIHEEFHEGGTGGAFTTAEDQSLFQASGASKPIASAS